MEIFVDPSGKILEIVFFLKNNTLITAAEIDALEKAIKTNVSFNLRSDETRGGDFFAISQIVKFSRILDGTQR
jgi:hypothetical protein